MNLSLVTKSTGKHPWFPGPLLVHRSKGQDEFQHFWQAVKRGCPAHEKLKVLWTDEYSAVNNGILSETLGTVHLLSFEHVKANIERKLDELKFPAFEKCTLLLFKIKLWVGVCTCTQLLFKIRVWVGVYCTCTLLLCMGIKVWVLWAR